MSTYGPLRAIMEHEYWDKNHTANFNLEYDGVEFHLSLSVNDEYKAEEVVYVYNHGFEYGPLFDTIIRSAKAQLDNLGPEFDQRRNTLERAEDLRQRNPNLH